MRTPEPVHPREPPEVRTARRMVLPGEQNPVWCIPAGVCLVGCAPGAPVVIPGPERSTHRRNRDRQGFPGSSRNRPGGRPPGSSGPALRGDSVASRAYGCIRLMQTVVVENQSTGRFLKACARSSTSNENAALHSFCMLSVANVLNHQAFLVRPGQERYRPTTDIGP